MGISFNGWSPSYDDIRKELEELLSRARNEEERRIQAQEVIRDVWREKLPHLFGKSCPSAEPLFAPSQDEEVFLTLHRFFEVCLEARGKSLENKKPFIGALVTEETKAAIKAHGVAIQVLGERQLLSKPLEDLLMQITARSTQYSLALETVALMESVLGEEIKESLRLYLLKKMDADGDALMECYKYVKSCVHVKEGDEAAKERRDALQFPTLIKYFPGDQEMESLFRTLKTKSEEKPRGYFSWW